MNDILKAVILGIAEGLTEFLPISSTGHLILLNEWVFFSEGFTNMFNIVIQLGAIFAVLIYFREKLIFWGPGVSTEKREKTIQLWLKTLIGIIPMIIIGAIFKDAIEEYLFNPRTVALALIIWGVVLIGIESRKKESKYETVDLIDYKTAFYIGIIQCLAMVPGTSRSAATIVGGMLLGASRIAAAQFSFFLAVPTMFIASGYSLVKTGLTMTGIEALTLLTGFVVSFIVALFVVAGLMRYISRRDFRPFGYYRIILGVLVLVYFLR